MISFIMRRFLIKFEISPQRNKAVRMRFRLNPILTAITSVTKFSRTRYEVLKAGQETL